MARYQIYDETEHDYIVIDEEEFTRREVAKREEARNRFLNDSNPSSLRPDAAYVVYAPQTGLIDETEDEYTQDEIWYRNRCRIPDGCVPRLNNSQRIAAHKKLEEIRVLPKEVDILTEFSELAKFIQTQNPVDIEYRHPFGIVRAVVFNEGNEIHRILEAVINGR